MNITHHKYVYVGEKKTALLWAFKQRVAQQSAVLVYFVAEA
jgi:hypothetical protein